jgi:hypothetical protein
MEGETQSTAETKKIELIDQPNDINTVPIQQE